MKARAQAVVPLVLLVLGALALAAAGDAWVDVTTGIARRASTLENALRLGGLGFGAIGFAVLLGRDGTRAGLLRSAAVAIPRGGALRLVVMLGSIFVFAMPVHAGPPWREVVAAAIGLAGSLLFGVLAIAALEEPPRPPPPPPNPLRPPPRRPPPPP